METHTTSISLTPDENGLVGRECPSCKMYFKIKPGTGIKTIQCICPYCGFSEEGQAFLTQDQKDYAISMATKQFLEPMFHDLANSLKNLETPSNGFLQIKVSTSVPVFQIQHYQEKILETNVTCDSCELVFSIYGVFSNCPDCGKLNARVIYEKSLDASKGKLLLAEDDKVGEHIRADLIKDALVGTVSAFDSLGKALRAKHAALPKQPKNLFQNFIELDKALKNITGKNISQFMTVNDSGFLFKMFQVRHIFEHNAGVIDSDFVKKLPAYSSQLGRKFPLKKEEISAFIVLMCELGDKIYCEFEK